MNRGDSSSDTPSPASAGRSGDPPRPPGGPPPEATGLQATAIGTEQLFLSAAAEAGTGVVASSGHAYFAIGSLLRETGMEVVHERIFGSLSAESTVMETRAAALEAGGLDPATPVTYIQGHPPWGEGFAGVLVQAVSTREPESEVWTIADGARPCGRGWRRAGSTFLFLQDMHGLPEGSGDPGSRPEQTRRMIERAERILRQEGASYGDVIRTWFYLHDILDWYDDFNRARSAKYGEIGIMPEEGGARLLLPASTGIGGVAPHRSAGALDLVAVLGPEESRPKIEQLTSAGQKDAFRYGSAFSRGALIEEEGARVIQLSGTASIDEAGATIHVGDPRAQIECTLDKIEALLSPAGAGLGDVCAATAFVKEPAFAELFWESVARRGLPDLPAVCVVADVCRDDLLFEMDGEVVFDHEPA